MIRKGIQFRRVHNYIFRSEGGVYNWGDHIGNPYDQNFLTIYKASLKPIGTKTLVSEGRTWYLKPVKMVGHSRTNMIYGELIHRAGVQYRRVYWVEDAKVYMGLFRPRT
jgi:hypothetical protein